MVRIRSVIPRFSFVANLRACRNEVLKRLLWNSRLDFLPQAWWRTYYFPPFSGHLVYHTIVEDVKNPVRSRLLIPSVFASKSESGHQETPWGSSRVKDFGRKWICMDHVWKLLAYMNWYKPTILNEMLLGVNVGASWVYLENSIRHHPWKQLFSLYINCLWPKWDIWRRKLNWWCKRSRKCPW